MRTVIKVCVSVVATGLLFLSTYAGAAESNAKARDGRTYESLKTCQKECKSARKDMSNEAYEECMGKCWKEDQQKQIVPPVKK